MFLRILLIISSFATLTVQENLMINGVMVEPQVLERTSNIFLTLTNSTALHLESLSLQEFSSPEMKALSLVETLELHAEETQFLMKEFLDVLQADYTSYWISNELFIRDADPSFTLAMIDAFGDQLSEVREEKVLQILETFDVKEVEDTSHITDNNLAWGVEKLQAKDMWVNDFMGQEIVVGVLDTGVKADHEALVGKVTRTKDFTVTSGLDTAVDTHGHGTHCCGTIAGGKGIGMAPKATLNVCKCCTEAGCPESALKSCGQWMCCTGGKELSCPNNPRVVSNSWGNGPGDAFYQSVIDAWINAGIFPVFAAGNSGSSCKTAGSPGDYSKCFSVGAIDINGHVTDFSSRGPSSFTKAAKPEVVAPGKDIVSCGHATTTSYRSMSGTSMACPHVAGMAALLLSRNPSLTNSMLKDELIKSCSHDLSTTGQTCGGTKDSVFPNYVSGSGLPKCSAALKSIERMEEEGMLPKQSDKAVR